MNNDLTHITEAINPRAMIMPGVAIPAGHVGTCVISASDDEGALFVWLEAKTGLSKKGALQNTSQSEIERSQNTFESYSREGRRLLLWARECGLNFKQMTVEDVHAFYRHLSAPPPHWIRPRKPTRDQNLLETQVLIGKLSLASIDYTRRVLSQLFRYLQDAGYIQRNVFRLSRKPAVLVESAPTRLLDLESWEWLWKWITDQNHDKPRGRWIAARTRWLFALLYHTGMRREEVARGRMGDFQRKDNMWSLRVVGKGRKERFVSINSALLRELSIYRNAMGLSKDPAPGEQTPLISNLSQNEDVMTPRSIGRMIHVVSEAAAKQCVDPHIQKQIADMTTHWMRHTNATHRLLAGASLETTQDELGHADPKTTRIYAKVLKERRKTDAEKLANLSSNSVST